MLPLFDIFLRFVFGVSGATLILGTQIVVSMELTRLSKDIRYILDEFNRYSRE